MKQFTIEYENQTQLANRLDRIGTWSQSNKISGIWIQVYVMEENGESIMPIADTISFCLPEAKFVITHAGLAFASGSSYKAETIIVCNLFEEEDARVELLQYDFTPGTYDTTVDRIIEYVKANPWIKFISINSGASVDGIRHLDRLAEKADPEIVMSGGAAINRNLSLPAKTISSGGPLSTSSLILTYIGGRNFHARADVIVGWKGIGREFTVTKSEGPVLYELDGKPAFETYKKYLKINSNPGVVINQTIEFPLCFEKYGITNLRCPFVLNEDGSIVLMMNDLKEGDKVRLAYGAPDMILDSISEKLNALSDFEPQILSVNSCLGRLYFWGDNINNELEFFKKVTLSSGFLTGGEFLRRGNHMLLLNETIVVTAMREGEKSSDGSGAQTVSRGEKSNSLTQRLAAFIEMVTEDLEAMAVKDGLTGLNNRREIDRIIEDAVGENRPFSLIMADADYFKQINDLYGHEEGDRTLKFLADKITELIEESGKEIHAGRFGGDEFIIMLPDQDKKAAVEFAEELRKRYCSKTAYDKIDRTLSIGIVSADQETDIKNIFRRVDEKLYEAKNRGKDCIVC